ncbi:MAG: DUF1501 domain-containing protein [Ferruginibacter sp.]|nr:DUF1501 domain-containing protein [Ferruginibacter sp.]
MKRRNFLRNSAISAVGLPGIFNGLDLTAHADDSLLGQFFPPGTANDHILVVIQMSGGNDGLNTVIPLDQYGNYVNARSNIALAQNKVLALTGTIATGLHSSLTGLRDLYDEGKLSIIQSAGYPTPSFSHFRATDIWMTAADSDQYLSDGWIGRYLNGEYPGYPSGYPTTNMPDPLGIQFGSGTSLSLLGPTSPMGYTISDPNSFINNADGGEDIVPTNTPIGQKLQYVRDVSKQAQVYYNAVKNAYNLPGNANQATYPSNSLTNQLKIVARLINGGLKTKIYVVSFGGFDTHSVQTNTNDTSTGAHANLMATLGNTIKAFHSDLKLMNKDQRVIGMTFSEFGRRIKSNASGGTDHGYAAPMFIFGSQVTGGIIGSNPIIPAVAGVNDNIPMQNDFRSIYFSIMKRWLCQDSTSLQQIMLKNFTEHNICNNVNCAPLGRSANPQLELVRNSPNPILSATKVEFKTQGGHTLLQLVSPEGLLISTLLETTYDRPQTIIKEINLSSYKPGMYYLRFQNGSNQQMKPIMKVQ